MDLFGEPVVEKDLPLDEQEGGWVRVIRPRSKSRRISVAEIRDLEHTLHLAAPKGETKGRRDRGCGRMNEQAENAFLKTLEEPPDGTLLDAALHPPAELLPTILSRCVQVKLTGGRALAADGGDELVASLNEVASRGFGGPVAALTLKSVFTDFLAVKKAEAEAAAKAALQGGDRNLPRWHGWNLAEGARGFPQGRCRSRLPWRHGTDILMLFSRGLPI